MPDWTKSMVQTFEYYTVDPGTWKDSKRLDDVVSSNINRDEGTDTLSSASFDVTNNFGEQYVRIYLITIQNGVTEKFPLGTFLSQTPSTTFDGKVTSNSIQAYSPLLELKEKKPPLGYSRLKGDNIMKTVYDLTVENVRAPVVNNNDRETLYTDFVADPNESWLDFLSALQKQAKYKFYLDELGRILFEPIQEVASLQPVVTFDDGNSSILYPSVTINHDIYGIPNVVEVIYSSGTEQYYAEAINDDENSPLSIQNRGRRIVHRVVNPDNLGNPTEGQIIEYANTLLKSLSTVEYSVTYEHGYYPVSIGDCVRLNYERAGLVNVKAKIVSQSIECRPGCKVTETAVFTQRFWGG